MSQSSPEIALFSEAQHGVREELDDWVDLLITA